MRNLLNLRIPDASCHLSKTILWLIKIDENEKVLSIEPMPKGFSLEGEDWHGDCISPMGIDLQINGGLGVSFIDLDFDKLPKLLRLLDHLWEEGVEAITPTLVSCSVSSLRRSLEVFRVVRNEHIRSSRCQLFGAHLEGPFLSKDFKGAHDSSQLCLPSLGALNDRISGFEDEVKIVTLAPELPGAIDVIRRLKSLGIIVSLGHSSADSEMCRIAFDEGVNMITHSFNAMQGLHHRNPGPLGEALFRGGIPLGLISDGVHVHPKILLLLHKLASDQIFLVSDALSAYGLKTNEFEWEKRSLFIDQGACRFQDGTLAGTIISLLDGCRKLAKFTGNPSAAIWAATVAPRLILDKERVLKDFLIGQSLTKLLRWNFSSSTKSLNWSSAK